MSAMTRTAPGVYRVQSERDPAVSYRVQVAHGRGVCDCLGALTHESECKHVRACKRLEDTMTTTETTAVAVRQPGADLIPMRVEPPQSSLPSMDQLRVITTIANSIYQTRGTLIPKEIDSSQKAFAVMLAGHELGIPPMASFREIFIVNGRTVPSARVLMGLVLRGDPQAAFVWFERSEKRAHARLTRGNGMTVEVEYTIEDAQRAKLTNNPTWTTYPKDMLAYRCVSRLCRLGGPDLITMIGVAVRGAPAVMEAIEEADGEPLPALEVTVVEPDASEPPQAPVAVPDAPPGLRIARLLAAFPAAQRATLVDGINLKFGRKVLTQQGETMLGKAAMTAAEREQVLALLERVGPVVDERVIEATGDKRHSDPDLTEA